MGRVATLDKLEGDVTLEARVDEPGGGMDEEAETAQGRLSLETGHHVVAQLDSLQGGSQDEFPGVEHERLLLTYLDQLGEVGLRVARVDLAVPVVDEHPEPVTHPQVDRGRLDIRRLVRVDLDKTRFDGLAYGTVREDHCGAGEGNRTLAPSLGSSCSTIELHPRSTPDYKHGQ